MKYFVVGVLQQQDAPHEWRHVDAVVDAADWKRAALDAAGPLVGQRWPEWPDSERTGWNYWLLAVVELSPGLPVVYSGSEVSMPDVADTEAEYGDPSRGPLWVAAGQDEAGSTWVLRLRGRDEEDVTGSVREFLNDLYGGDEEAMPDDPYGMVREDGGGRYTVFPLADPPRTVSTYVWGQPLRPNSVEALKERLT